MYNSSEEFYTGDDYYKNNPGWHEEGSKWKADLIAQLINKFQLPVKTIVEVGCGAGEVLAELGRQLPVETVFRGYDISARAIEIASRKSTARLSFILGDYTRMNEEQADLVLIIDVAEHVDDVYSFLRRLRDKGKNFIFHIPLDMSCRTLLKPHTLLQQRTSVGHIHYFTEETVLWMLADIGYKVEHYSYTKPDIDTQKPRSVKQWTKKMLRKISFAINKKLSVKLWGNYSLLILAKPVTK